jgi:uncharacterized RDD family membrane protein YckC
MQCRYCRAWNDEDERRCSRCGRRMHSSGLEGYALSTATAPALDSWRGPWANEEPLPSAPPERASFQPSLFRDASGAPKVIPIPTLTPARSFNDEPVRVRRHQARTPRSGSSRRPPESQQTLDFQDPYVPAQTLALQTVIYCDAPVALPAHRMIAAAFDASMVMIASGLFLAIFVLSGGDIVISKQSIPMLLCLAAVLGFFYRALFCMANGDTPGMRFAGLKLVDFDGRPPDRDQRGLRQVASVLSLLSAGLGLVWALVDEENLTWHDHISKTFPTTG